MTNKTTPVLSVALSVLATLVAPAAFANDSANIQDSYQINTTRGTNNTSVQTSTQNNRDFRNGSTRGNSGSSQTNTQDSLTEGGYNVNVQDNRQGNTTIRNRNR